MNLKQSICMALTASLLSMPLPVLAAEAQTDTMQAEDRTAVTEASTADAAEAVAAEDSKAVKDTANKASKKNVAAKSKQQTYSLKFDKNAYTEQTMQVDGKDVAFRAYENIVYVAKPIAKESQEMSIYIPEAYFTDGTINGYTKKTAPIFMPNGVGGYMPGQISAPSESDRMNGGANASLVALSKGYVVAAPAIRGRTTVGDDGKTYVGKAPALIVDYKAAVRYLRYNKHRLPAGDTEKIISNGTSAGGALSSLLGATGDSHDYDADLQAIGAAKERDDIFASSVYCPITDLEHADMAYEWMFSGVNDAHENRQAGALPTMPQANSSVLPLMPGPFISGSAGDEAADEDDATVNNRPDNAPRESTVGKTMTPKQIAASSLLKSLFPVYLNSLKLTDESGAPLTLSSDGTGSFAAYIKSLYAASAQSALDKGEDLSDLDWLTMFNNKVIAVNLNKYAIWATRLKATPAFDKFDLSSGENDEFGTTDNEPRHFTGFSMRRNEAEDAEMADSFDVKRLNPLRYIGQKGVRTAQHWRIRHGAKDRDTSIAVPAILATKLKDSGAKVDFKSPWGYGHAGDYDLDELFDWIDSICKPEEKEVTSKKAETTKVAEVTKADETASTAKVADTNETADSDEADATSEVDENDDDNREVADSDEDTDNDEDADADDVADASDDTADADSDEDMSDESDAGQSTSAVDDTAR